MYSCKRCNYSTNHKTDMERHFMKINKCQKKIDFYEYSNNDLYKMSLLKNNKKAYEGEPDNHCSICCKSFTRLDNYKRHMKTIHEEKIFIYPIIENQNEIEDININLRQFNEEWSTEHIDEYYKLYILIGSKLPYKDLFIKILENNKNLNFLLDNETNYAITYEKDIFENIKKDILHEKINNKLNELMIKIKKDYIEKNNELIE